MHMMKSLLKINRIFTGFAALLLLAGFFPAVSGASASISGPVPSSATSEALTVAVPSSPQLTVTPGSCLVDGAGSVRIDHLLNANCTDLITETLPAWPHLSVIQASSPEVSAINLPAPPPVRWGNNGISIAVPNLAILPSSLYINLFVVLLAFILISGVLLLIGRIQLSKSLSELQVQRC
jgi:hypothetical protein